MSIHDEREIGRLLRRLRPVPAGWVEAAQELVTARAAVDGIVARAEADAAVRARVVADLEAALEAEGVRAAPHVVDALRARLR